MFEPSLFSNRKSENFDEEAKTQFALSKAAKERYRSKKQLETSAGLHTLGPNLELALWEKYFFNARDLDPGVTADTANAGDLPTEQIHTEPSPRLKALRKNYQEALEAAKPEYQPVTEEECKDYAATLENYASGQGTDKITPEFTIHVRLITDIKKGIKSNQYHTKQHTLKEIADRLIGWENSVIKKIIDNEGHYFFGIQDPDTSEKDRSRYISESAPYAKAIKAAKERINQIREGDLRATVDTVQKYLALNLNNITNLTTESNLLSNSQELGWKITVDDDFFDFYAEQIAQLLTDLETLKQE